MPSKQFRTVGPVILEHYTPADLLQVQQAAMKALHNNNTKDNEDESIISSSGGKIKYLVLNKGGGGTLMVFAQATAKMTTSAWHKCLGYGFKDIQPPIDNREALNACMNKENGAVYEEYGITPSYHKTAGIVMLGPKNMSGVAAVVVNEEVLDNHQGHNPPPLHHASAIAKKISKETRKRERRARKWLHKARKELRLPDPRIIPMVVAAYKLQTSLFEDCY